MDINNSVIMDDFEQQFEDYQEFLKISETKKRYENEFETDKKLFDLLEELNEKTIDTENTDLQQINI